MVKKVKNSSSEPEKITEDTGKVPVFSWNLEQGKLDLEDGISLHESIKFSHKSLGEFKDVARKELIDTLNGCFDIDVLKESTEKQINKNKVSERERIDKILEKMNELKESTENQINKNKISERERIAKILENFDKKRKEEQSRKDGVELIQSLQEINDQQNAELANIKNQTLVLEKEQTDLKKQRKFLAMLTSSEIWDALLLMPEEDAPWVSLNVGGSSYEIKKGEKYENEDEELKIKKVIEEKMLDFDVFDDDYVKFVLGFVLRPFDIEHDKGTIKYYVYSIIDCIKNTDIVSKIGELYEKKQKLEGMLDSLERDLSDNKMVISEIENIREKYNNISEAKILFKSGSEFKKGALKKGAFIAALEECLANESIKFGDKETIREFIETLKKSGNDTIETVLNDKKSDSINGLNLENLWDFEPLFFEIGRFLGVEWSNGKKWELKKLLFDMNSNFIGKEDSLDVVELRIKELNGGRIKNLNKDDEDELKKLITHNGGKSEMVNKLRTIIRKKKEAIINGNRLKLSQNDVDLYSKFRNLCRRSQFVAVGDRREVINSCFVELFGVSVQESKTRDSDDDKTLMKNMVKALIDSIRTDKENDYKIIDGMLTDWLEKKQYERDMIKYIDMTLGYILYNYFKDFDGNSYNEEKESLENGMNQFKSQLDECCDIGEFEKIEDEIREIGNSDNLSDLKSYGEILDLCKNWETCDLWRVDKDYHVEYLLGLKRLFSCDKLTLREKFDYGDIILKNKNLKIVIKTGEHEMILKSIFGEGKASINEDCTDDNEYKRNEKILLEKLKGLGKGEEVVNEFVLGLKSLGLEESQGKEIIKMYKLFPEAVDSYIEVCIQEGAFKFGKSLFAINYTTGSFNFSVIQAGILKEAVEKGEGFSVMEYLGFFLGDEEKMEVISKDVAFKTTVCNLIEYLRENRIGCFNDGYLRKEEGWRKLNFGKKNNLIQKKTKKHKFGIGKSGQSFRLAGVENHGYYVITHCYVIGEHDKGYNDYISANASENDKLVFKNCTGVDY